MVKFFFQSHQYNEPWQTVTLAFFLRYPNPYATHVLSADVLERTFTNQGTLLTTRLILKRGNIPKWMPRGIVSRAESWIVEQSEVDPLGKIVRCETRNLDHVKILSVRELVVLKEGDVGSTFQKTEAKVVSKLGWLARRVERYGHEKFQRNMERSRAGIHLIVDLLRQSRLQAMPLKHMHAGTLSAEGTALDSFRPRLYSPTAPSASSASEATGGSATAADIRLQTDNDEPGRRWKWSLPRVASWLWRPSSCSHSSNS